MPAINIEDALPAQIRKLRFNQKRIADRFGTFKDFLIRHDDKIGRKRRPDLERVIQDHYDKYGSSEEESQDISEPHFITKEINVTCIPEDM